VEFVQYDHKQNMVKLSSYGHYFCNQLKDLSTITDIRKSVGKHAQRSLEHSVKSANMESPECLHTLLSKTVPFLHNGSLPEINHYHLDNLMTAKSII